MLIASNADSASRSFFLPGVAVEQQEREYERLRACASLRAGSKPSAKRIEGLECRLGGSDCAFKVGQLDPVDGAEVVAILDLGRDQPYGIFTTADRDAPALIVGKPVYSVTQFG